MCGIAGIVHKDPARPIDPARLVAMAAIQHHRGPDGFGTAVANGVGFSHARLSIIDLETERARQPFTSADGRLMLTANGELYDFQRLRAELTARGARFRSKSDSELILHLYRELGFGKMLGRLRGEFAFALHDADADTVWLVRDRFGIKPLYWTGIPEGIVFGSEIKAIFAHPAVRRELDASGLFHQLMQATVPGTTAFAGVHQVEPGHCLEIRRRDGALRVARRRYWDIDFPRAGDHAGGGGPTHVRDSGYWVDGVRERLVEAVHLRLVADVPVGCYLSGGIDSCSIMGIAAAASQQPVRAFTIGFDSEVYDETPIARQMAEATGARHDVLRIDPAALYDNFEETIWHTERTIYNTLGVAKLLMSRRVNEVGYKVVLTGEGSDELFAGYPAFRRDMYLHGLDDRDGAGRAGWESLLTASNQQFRGAMLAEEAVTDAALDAVVGFTPSCLQPWLAAAKRVPALLAPALRDELEGYEPGRAIADALDAGQLEGRHALDKAQYVWIKTMLEGQILTWGGDRVDMASSMEARPAFLDHRLAEFARTIPPSMRIRGRTEKHVLREAMRGLLPDALYRREKFAFMAPPAHTDRRKSEALGRLAERHLSAERIAETGLLDAEGVRAVFALLAAGDTSAATRVQLDAIVNHLIGVQLLHRQFIAADLPAEAGRHARRLDWAA